jgi:DNA-binding NtrC family response regulator
MNEADKRLARLIEDVDNVARVMEAIAAHMLSDTPILLIGPRSTGAQLLSEAIHASSARFERPFVRARCGLYSGILLEAQLFGKSHARGGCHPLIASRKQGMVERADRGTLFIEQIQNATPSVQTLLFDVIANKEYLDFERTSIHHADVRLIASARYGLKNRVGKGQFLPHLYAQFESHCIELNDTCESRERILSVIDLLRTDVSLQAATPLEGGSIWWMDAARTATQTAVSVTLRNAVKAATREHAPLSRIEPVLFSTLHCLSQWAMQRERTPVCAN